SGGFEGWGKEDRGEDLPAVPDHGFAGGGAEQREDRDLGVRPLSEGLAQRPLRGLAFLLHPLEYRRLVQAQADPDRDDEQDAGEQERNAPAPIAEGFFALPAADAEDQQQCKEQAQRGGGLNPGGVGAALAGRRRLGGESRATAILAAERETLYETEQDQHDRRSDAPGAIARQQADEEGADAHQRHGDQEGVF